MTVWVGRGCRCSRGTVESAIAVGSGGYLASRLEQDLAFQREARESTLFEEDDVLLLEAAEYLCWAKTLLCPCV